MFESVLVANRGEIARRIIRTVQRMGLKAVAVYSEADANLPFVREADEAIASGRLPRPQSYLDVEAVLEAAAADRRRGGPPGLRVPGRGRRVRAAGSSSGPDLGRPVTGRDRAMGDKITPATWWRRPACRCRGDTATPVADVAAAAVGRAGHRLPADGQGARRRWRHGHGASASDEDALRAEFERVQGVRRAHVRRLLGSCSSGSSPASATSRCRSSGWPTAGSSRWASATARCSDATRRSSRRRRRPGVTPELRASDAGGRGPGRRGRRLPQRGHRRVPGRRRRRETSCSSR